MVARAGGSGLGRAAQRRTSAQKPMGAYFLPKSPTCTGGAVVGVLREIEGGKMPRPESIDPTAVYGVSDVADLMRCDRRVVYRAISSGELRSFVPSGCSRGARILGQWVIDWMSAAPRAEG